MIDAHIHVVQPVIPGCDSLSPVLNLSVPERAKVIRRQMKAAGVTQALAMGSYTISDDDPLGVASTYEVIAEMPNLAVIGVMDPAKDPQDRLHFKAVDKALEDHRIVALKGYLGYLHYEPAHANYRRYYELAEKHNVPVIFHTGDTYSAKAKIRFAHPLGVDDVAVDHPNVQFVLAHLGNPWMLDAAQVIYKNANVWADLSGLVIGDGTSFEKDDWEGAFNDIANRVMYAMHYSERPEKFVFGTDWPLIPMKGYRQFLADFLPKDWHAGAFGGNAKVLFRRIAE